MTIRQMKEKLSNFPDDMQVVLLDVARTGHDDAVLDFGIKKGFGINCGNYIDDVVIEGYKEECEYCEGDEVPERDTQCCCITFWK